ncbi:hypothetical protein M3Y99_00315300 [Aphelenchoides fujianensis]|nr:hypothetical protein M3Y99_00315300 [Aphelenchoides fujianensis]
MRLRLWTGCLFVGLLLTAGRALDSAIDELSSEELDKLDLSEEEDLGRFDPVKHITPTSVTKVCKTDKSEGELCKCKTEKVKDDAVSSLMCVHKDRDTTTQLTHTKVQPADSDFKPTYVSFLGNLIEYIEGDSLLPGLEDTVTSIDFMHNHINEIDNNAFDKFKLRKLRLTENFVEITEDTDGWITEKLGETLEKLYLGYNRIVEINDDAFSPLHKLKTLVLDGNPGIILTDSTFKSGLPELEKFSLDYCGLTSLPTKLFKNLPKLKAISLIGNPMTAIPKALNLVNSLEILDLSRTELTEFTKNALKDDHSVKQLYLTKMKYMYELDDCAFCGLTNLAKVDLGESKHLHMIHKNAFGRVENKDESPKALTTLLLDKCNVSKLPEELVEWTKLTEMDISGNPLNCDEDLYWLFRDLASLHLKGETVATCAQPKELAGQTIQQAGAQLGEKAKPPVGGGFPIFRVFIALVFLSMVAGIVVFGIIFCNRRAHLDLDDEFADEEERTSTPPPAAV